MAITFVVGSLFGASVVGGGVFVHNYFFHEPEQATAAVDNAAQQTNHVINNIGQKIQKASAAAHETGDITDKVNQSSLETKNLEAQVLRPALNTMKERNNQLKETTQSFVLEVGEKIDQLESIRQLKSEHLKDLSVLNKKIEAKDKEIKNLQTQLKKTEELCKQGYQNDIKLRQELAQARQEISALKKQRENLKQNSNVDLNRNRPPLKEALNVFITN